jgi:hypothetical protein
VTSQFKTYPGDEAAMGCLPKNATKPPRRKAGGFKRSRVEGKTDKFNTESTKKAEATRTGLRGAPTISLTNLLLLATKKSGSQAATVPIICANHRRLRWFNREHVHAPIFDKDQSSLGNRLACRSCPGGLAAHIRGSRKGSV